jgi:ornithine cyclodeaminase/alanine dehydrogenase-like protein (mu-crystallin family)
MDFSIDAIAESEVIVVDNWKACAAAPKIFRDAVQLDLISQDQVVELPTYISAESQPITYGAGRTFVNLVGMAIQDIVLASHVLDRVDQDRCVRVSL